MFVYIIKQFYANQVLSCFYVWKNGCATARSLNINVHVERKSGHLMKPWASALNIPGTPEAGPHLEK